MTDKVPRRCASMERCRHSGSIAARAPAGGDACAAPFAPLADRRIASSISPFMTDEGKRQARRGHG